MHDTDALIQNITGTTNYVKELEKVCGNLEHIEMDYFKVVNAQNCNADAQLRSIIKRICSGSSDEIVKEFFTLSITINYNDAIEITEKRKKSKGKIVRKEVVRDRFRPKQFVKSDYFKIIKKLEKTANNLLESFGTTIEKVMEVNHNNPELAEIKNFYGYRLINEESLANIIAVKSNCTVIIDNYMKPLYDMKKTIVTNWAMLDPLFRRNDLGTNIVEIQQMLYLFMVSKYRCAITDNNKYYAKLFANIVSNKGDKDNDEIALSKMDSSRFLELLDTINLESIDKKQRVYTFATVSKDIIKRIVAKKEPMEVIMKDVNEMLQKANETTETTATTTLPATATTTLPATATTTLPASLNAITTELTAALPTATTATTATTINDAADKHNDILKDLL